jgi:hypothetical protein
MKYFKSVTQVIAIALFMACSNGKPNEGEKVAKNSKTNMTNPVVYFEIPVTDINRAMAFYKAVFQFDFSRQEIDHNEMALFPFTEGNAGISGALAKGEIYKPAKEGVLVYFATNNIEQTLKLATANGAKVLYPVTDNGIGLVAEFEDTEGNRIALYQNHP